LWTRFLDRYCTVDTRTLGLFRIYFGLLLLSNLWDRAGGFDLVSFYTNEGVLPNHWALFRPPASGYWSLMLGFSSPNEVGCTIAFIGLVYFLYTLGWKTKWMQVLALLCYASLNLRFLLIQHGGNVVMNIVLVWTVFLPIGARYSVDSLLRSLRGAPERTPEALSARGWMQTVPRAHVGFAFFGICLNFAFIYFFNTLHKGGPSWMDGTAVHYVLWQNRMATALDAWVRMHEPFWLSPLLTWGTLFAEGSMVLLILSPWKQRWLRTWAFVTCWGLHGGIAALSTLGPFSYSMMGFGVLMIHGDNFDFLNRKLRRAARARVVRVDFAQPLQHLGARILARMDLLEQLTFEKGARFEVVTPDGKAVSGLSAWAQATRALPLGRPGALGVHARRPLVPREGRAGAGESGRRAASKAEVGGANFVAGPGAAGGPLAAVDGKLGCAAVAQAEEPAGSADPHHRVRADPPGLEHVRAGCAAR
jgi:hypothetical protein